MRADTSRRQREGNVARPLCSRRRLVAATVALASFLLVAQPAPSQTEAAWVRQGSAAASFTAGVAKPPIAGCVAPGVLGTNFTVTFTPPPGLTASEVNFQFAYSSSAAFTNPTVWAPSVTGPNGSGQYSVVYNSAILGLSGSVYIGVRANLKSDTAWVSGYALAVAQPGLLGLGPTCTLV